ncbi:hypothetical protein LINPERPRIM_LOCUS21134, partial [Linum perenne]
AIYSHDFREKKKKLIFFPNPKAHLDPIHPLTLCAIDFCSRWRPKPEEAPPELGAEEVGLITREIDTSLDLGIFDYEGEGSR